MGGLLALANLFAKPVSGYLQRKQELARERHAGKMQVERQRIATLGSFGMNLILIIVFYPLFALCVLWTINVLGWIDDFKTPVQELVDALQNLLGGYYHAYVFAIVSSVFALKHAHGRQMAKAVQNAPAIQIPSPLSVEPQPEPPKVEKVEPKPPKRKPMKAPDKFVPQQGFFKDYNK